MLLRVKSEIMPRSFTVLLLVLTTATMSLAQDWLAKGDHLTRWGALKEADAAYLKAETEALTPEQSRTLLFRRLALAEALGDPLEVESLLKRAAQLPQSTEVKIRTLLVKANMAQWTGQFTQAKEHFETLAELAGQSTEPYAIFAHFAAQSYLYRRQIEREGWPSRDVFKKESLRIFTPVFQLPQKELFEPLALTRTNPSMEFWILANLKQRAGDKPAMDELSLFVWALQLGLADRLDKLKDPEAGGLAVHYPLIMAEGLAQSTPSEAQKWLNNVGLVLKIGQKLVSQAQLGAESSGLSFFQARHQQTQAKIDLRLGRQRKALQHYKRAVNLMKKAGLDTWLSRVYLDYSQALLEHGRATEGLALAQRATTTAKGVGDRLSELKGLQLMGRAAEQQGQNQEALGHYLTAVKVLEDNPTYPFGNSAARAYESLISVLASLGQTAKALEYQQHKNAWQQIDNLDIGHIESQDPALQKALSKTKASQDQARALQSKLEAAQTRQRPGEVEEVKSQLAANRAEYLRSLNELNKVNPDYANLVAIRPTAFTKLQSHLPTGALLVQYSQTPEELLIFTATSENLSIEKVALKKDQLNQIIKDGRRALARLQADPSNFHQLYTHLIAPIEKEVDAAQVVLFAPSESLYHVPFAALSRVKNGKTEYLVERKALVTITGPELVLELSNSLGSAGQGGLLAFGDPDGSLPAARKEVEAISQLFESSQVYTAADAKSEHLKDIPVGTSCIHLATHAIVNPKDVNSSYLLMAGSGKNSELSLGEIYGLQLAGVNLVTLSACESALGEERPTWAVASLAQAFNLAGAQTLVASLWQVSDDATHELMVHFYTQLREGKTTAEALRFAQKQLLKTEKYKHPYFWSGFSLIGDWR